jgi:hypothetical protein
MLQFRSGARLSRLPVLWLVTALLLSSCGGGGGGNAGGSTPTPVPAPSGLSYPSPQTYTIGTAIQPLVPTVSGTVNSYSVAPALPAGLSIDPSSGHITGTPTTAAAVTSTITALNGSGSATFQLTINVQAPPSSFSYNSPQTYTVGVRITTLSPTVSGPVGSYSVSPALPAGLSLDASTGQITGTPTTPSPPMNYLITGQRGGGATTFLLSIAVLIPPPSGLSYPGPNTFTVGQQITPLNPTVTGIVSAYSVSPALPAGLALNTTTGQISGTPTVNAGGATYFVRASNGSGVALTNLFIEVRIAPPSSLSYPSPQVFTATAAITPISPTVTGTVSFYSVSPALPAGLTLNPATGQISGTPSVVAPATIHTITAANSSGSTSFSLSLTVRVAPPTNLSYRSPVTYPVGAPITPLNPSVLSTVASYTVSPALPAGLALDPATGRITGTPSAAATAAAYVVTASNSSGSANFSLSLQVVLLAPRGLSYAGPLRLADGLPMLPVDPFVIGVVSNYSVVPALPAGMTLDAATGRISGTPTGLALAADYVVTASNASGSTTYTLSISVAGAGVSPASISRLVAVGTPVSVALDVTSATLPAGATIFAAASSPANVFAPAVATASTAAGYALQLTVSTTAPAGRYTGNVTLTLCADAACTTPLTPATVVVPYDIRVLSSASGWSGDNLTALAPWLAAPDWTMYQGNAAHTGFVPVDVDPNRFTTRWQGPTLANRYQFHFVPTTLTTSGGRIFIAYNNTLFALSENDASQVWQYSFASLRFPSVNPPAVADGTVYIAAGQQDSTTLFAFDAADGSLVFRSAMTSQWEHYLAPTIGPQGVYTNAGTYGGLYGFAFSGQRLFFRGLDQQSTWTPAVDANRVYAYVGSSLTVVDPVTGAIEASIVDPTFQNYIYEIGGSAVLGAPGSVFAAAYANSFLNGGAIGNRLVRFNVASRSVAWQISGVYPTTPGYKDGVVYATNNNPLRLEARAESTGSLLWSWTPPLAGDANFVSEVMLTNTMAFVSTNLNVYGIDLATRRLVWSYPFPGSLALSQNGILYIQGAGPLTAINVR